MGVLRQFRQRGVNGCRVILLSLLMAGAAGAATITVHDADDNGFPNANNCPGVTCRLRDALAAANNGDTINFAVSGVIGVFSEMPITKNITIAGPGASQFAVDGMGFSRVFHLIQGHTVVISGLTPGQRSRRP
jgi:hypothetical protein